MKRRSFLAASFVAPFFAIITSRKPAKPPMPPAKPEPEILRAPDGTVFFGPFTPDERAYIAEYAERVCGPYGWTYERRST